MKIFLKIAFNDDTFNLFIYLDHFADYKRLRGGVYFVESLPLTPSGKVIRRYVKEIAIKLYNETHEPDS